MKIKCVWLTGATTFNYVPRLDSLYKFNHHRSSYLHMPKMWSKYCSALKKGAWTKEEDARLKRCIEKYGEGKWHKVPLRAGLNRCRRSCQLRWLNYLHPNIKREKFSSDEINLIIQMQKLLGNRWSLIAASLPGRTGNDIKNLWNNHIYKSLQKKQQTTQCSDELQPEKSSLEFEKDMMKWLENLLFDEDDAENNSSSSGSKEHSMEWWENLLLEEEGAYGKAENNSHKYEFSFDSFPSIWT